MSFADCDEKTAQNVLSAITAGKIPDVTLTY
jgi:hypothetical protein